MSSNFDINNTKSIYHKFIPKLVKIFSEFSPFNDTTINIAFFGSMSKDDDLCVFKKYIFPKLTKRFPKHLIQVFMIDIVKTKRSGIIHKITENIYVTGIFNNLYEKIFNENTIDITLSFNCLYWFDTLPNYITTNNKFCMSLLSNKTKMIIKTVVNNNLQKFLTIRSKELTPNGQLIIGLYGDIIGECHQFQRTTECVSNILETLKKSWTDATIFSNCFILATPYSQKEIFSIIKKIPNISIDSIYAENAGCPFLEKYNYDVSSNKNQIQAKLDYTKNIALYIQQSIAPLLRNNIPGCNEYLIHKVNTMLFKYILEIPTNLSSTQGNIIQIHCYKGIN